MKQRILSTIIVLIAFVGIARSQSLSVEPLSLPTGAAGEIVVGLSGATEMTAIQFCISIPYGYELKEQGDGFGAVLGNATRGGHTLNVQQVGDEQLLVVVYSMHLNAFSEGTLVTIPIVASCDESVTATGSLYNIRMANKNAESFEYSNVQYTAEVKCPAVAVEPVTLEPGKSTTLEVKISNATAMTALQFILSLPNGVTLADNSENYGVSLGGATSGHIMSVQPLECGDYLVVLYNMFKDTFSDGTLLSIPVTAGENSVSGTGSLYNIRMSTADAVSHKCDDVSFKTMVATSIKGATVDTDTLSPVKVVYDLRGNRITDVDNLPKGVYIVNGKLVLVK